MGACLPCLHCLTPRAVAPVADSPVNARVLVSSSFAASSASRWTPSADSAVTGSDELEHARGRRVPSESLAEPVGESPNKSGMTLLATGFRRRDALQWLDGRYVCMERIQCGRAVFQKVQEPTGRHLPQGKHLATKPLVMYFWDDRDGWHLCGWWIGPEVGSNTVYAFNPGEADQPPADGWRQPWYADVVAKARVVAVSPDGEMGVDTLCSTMPDGAEVENERVITSPGMAEISVKLQDVIKQWQVPQALVQCADCRGAVQAPCVLPCGHVVCLEHVEKAQDKPKHSTGTFGEEVDCKRAGANTGAPPRPTVMGQRAVADDTHAGVHALPAVPTQSWGSAEGRAAGTSGAESAAAAEVIQPHSETQEMAREVALASLASFARATGVEVPTWLRSHSHISGMHASGLSSGAGPRNTHHSLPAFTRSSISQRMHRAALCAPLSRPFHRALRTYSCPYSPACGAHPASASAESKDWRTCGVVTQLLALAEHTCSESATSPSSRMATRQTASSICDGRADDAVLNANTPGRLIAAYENVGVSNGSANLHASAAAAFCAAYCLHEAFFQPPNAHAEMMVSGAAVGGGCSQSGLSASVAHSQNIARVKAAAWAKRCGEEALCDAVLRLPIPTLGHLASEVQERTNETIAALFKETSAARQILECPVCYRLLYQPVSTPCGHMFCRGCLARVLDAGSGCPLCRGALRGAIDFYAPCSALEVLEEALWPAEYAQRQKEAEVESLSTGDEEQTEGRLPIFIPGTFLVPSQPAVVHAVEPHHRLLIRRALESGTRRFGMCMAPQESDSHTASHPLGFAEYGTELKIRGVQMLPNGRSIIDVIGVRRFRVLDASQRDGYSIANVEYFDDSRGENSSQVTAVLEEFVRELRVLHDSMSVPITAYSRQDAGSGLDSFPAIEDTAACDAAGWAVLSRVPAPVGMKYHCLSLASRHDRFLVIINIMRKYMASAQGSPSPRRPEVEEEPEAAAEMTG